MTTKDTYIDRPFNIRPICFWAFFVALTVVVCLISRGAVLWVGVYFAVLIGLFIGAQFLKSRDKVLQFFGTSRLNFIITIALCLVVAGSFAVTTIAYTNQKSFAGYHDLTGTVERHNLQSDGSGWFVLRNAKFGDTAVSGKVQVYINNSNNSTNESVTSTYRVTLNTQLRQAPANDFNINNGIKYTANLGTNDKVTSIGTDNSIRSIVLRHSQNLLRAHMSERNADLMYAMLFGGRDTLDGELNTSFSLTGLAHILAVSGMHVGILVGMLLFVLKLFRTTRKQQLPIIFVILLIYCYLCGFRFSIMRASIMFLVFASRRVFLKSNDFLSSICVAGILILMLFPYSIMSVSFQASFACVFGIALFNLPFTNLWKKALRVKSNDQKIRNRLASALAMYCTIFIVWLPISIRYFGFVSLVGVVSNVLLLPLMIIAFQVSILSVLTWITFPLLYIVNVVLDACIAVTNWLASLPFSHISVSGTGYWFLLYFAGLIFTTRFIFLRPRYKYPIATILILIWAVFVVF